MKPWGKMLLAGACVALTATTVSLCFPAHARYNNTATSVIKYEHVAPASVVGTLSADTAVYDFGVWTPDVEEMEFAHTLRVAGASTTGILRFSWDETTRSQRDMTVYVDGEHYTSVQTGGYTDYTVSAVDGVVELPFSLIFANPITRRAATLDVSWYPADSDEPTLFARYLLAVMPNPGEGETAPTFVEDETYFLADRVLRLAVTTPPDSAGVQLAPTEGTFSADTRYRSDTYPQGVTLLRDSALYLERTGDSTHLWMDLSAHLTDNDPVSLTVGVSDTLCSTLSRTPVADASLLTVSPDNEACVVSAAQPLTITLTELSALRDSDWFKVDGTAVDLTWTLQQRVDGTLVPVTVGETLTVTVTQTDTGGTFTIAAPDGKQAPGTYLLTITQTYCGDPVFETPIWFFIDYR